jgi:error-prone DNA polymerase
MPSPFVHLHVHSDFSFMDGAAHLDGLIERAHCFGMPAVALTDHQGLYGAIRFYRRALAAGVKPILGAEVVVETCGIDGVEGDQPPDRRVASPPPTGFGRASAAGFHLTLLVKDIVGYRNLCRLLSRAHLREMRADGGVDGPERSVIALEDLARMSGGLIALSGCERGEVGASVLAGLPWRAHDAARRLAGCFAPGDFFIELVHTMTPGSPRYIAALANLAVTLHLPTVATNDVHYVRREDFRLHDVLSSVGALEVLPGPLARPNAELYFKSGSEMRRLFASHPEACDATAAIAERCDLDLGLGAFHFPSVEVPQGETPYSVLSKLAWHGLERRYRPVTPEAVRRLQHELSVIDRLGFSEYFLVVKDIVDFAKSRGIRCSGRGSAGDSIVTYNLGITDADPVAYDLLFERFLNPERRQMPDIDVDFDSARRDEVIDYIYRRFGAEHVAMVATVNTMTAKSAVRTAARALGRTPEQTNALSRHLPWVHASKIREVLDTYPECRNHPLKEPGNGLLLDVTEQLDGCAMHLGTHLGGFLITREPVDTWTPLQIAAKGVVVSQYDKDDVEALGLVKMDVLGLRMHTAISETVRLARERVGETCVPEPFELVPDDPKVYAGIAAADTVGMFQLESSGQRNLALRLRERDFSDIVAAISLFRPGPLEAEMITPFIRRRHGIEPVSVPHPAMGEVLRDTYGVIIYQEQVLQVAKAVAGFSLAEADSLRRAMTKGRSRADMEAMHAGFVSRAVALGSKRDAAEEVFRQLQGFAAYGFNKAHAACFGVVSYASAWLKTYYPAEFAASILNAEPMGFYSPRLVLDDARRHGIAVLPPDVNASSADCTPEHDGRAIRVGFKGLLNMNVRLLRAIEAEQAVRDFDDLADFLRRTRAEIDAAESLVRVGAFDGLGVTDAGRPPTRDELLALLPELKAVLAREGSAGERALVLAPSRARDPEDLSHPSGWSAVRRLGAEMELLGLAVTCHPLELARADLDRQGVTWAADLPRVEDRTRVRVAGVRERAQTPPTRTGKRVCFLTMEDPTGLLDVVVFPEALQRSGETIVKHRCYIVDGVLQNNAERGLAIVADVVRPYAVRTERGEQVRLRRGVGTAPMGPFRGTSGHTDEEEWETAAV